MLYIFQTWSPRRNETSKLPVVKQKCSTCYFPSNIPPRKGGKNFPLLTSFSAGWTTSSKTQCYCGFPCHLPSCVFTVNLTWCRDCATHKKHDADAVWDHVGPLSLTLGSKRKAWSAALLVYRFGRWLWQNRNVLLGHGCEGTYLLWSSRTQTSCFHSHKQHHIPLTPHPHCPQYYYTKGVASLEKLIKN